MTFGSGEISFSLIVTIFVMALLHALEVLEKFCKIDATSIFCQFAGVSGNRRKKVFNLFNYFLKFYSTDLKRRFILWLTGCVEMLVNVEYTEDDFLAMWMLPFAAIASICRIEHEISIEPRPYSAIPNLSVMLTQENISFNIKYFNIRLYIQLKMMLTCEYGWFDQLH